MALTGTEPVARLPAHAWPVRAWERLRARFGGAEHLVQRLAGTVFLIRVASALLAYGSQVLFARWMGTFEFGIYVYVWTWVLLLGPILAPRQARQRRHQELPDQPAVDDLALKLLLAFLPDSADPKTVGRDDLRSAISAPVVRPE